MAGIRCAAGIGDYDSGGKRLENIFRYSVGVQPFIILNMRMKEDRLVYPQLSAASVMDVSGSARSLPACSILFRLRY